MSEINNLLHWNGKIWDGVYQNFEEAGADKGVFDGSLWIDKQVASAKASIENFNSDELINPLGMTTDYALPFVSATISEREKPLKIIDFGGGLGASFLPLKAMLPLGQSLEFVVIEGRAICEQGRVLFDNFSEISFIEQMPPASSVDIINAGSSMHYVDDWIGLLKRFGEYAPKYMIFSDLPAANIDTFVTVQNYRGKKIPVRFWNLVEFVQAVESLGYRLVMKSRFRNEYLAYMERFDMKYRLNFFSQLVFQQH